MTTTKTKPKQSNTAPNSLKALTDLGQSIWLDYIRRSLITTGQLERLVAEEYLKGITSNPSIFEKAIAGSTDYQNALQSLQRRALKPMQVYETLAFRDIQDAAAVLRPVYDRTGGRDGYVSLEVSPNLAHDSRKTIEEARRLWKAVGRDNVMIKVPGTEEGLAAIEQLTADGININVTLLFSQEMYERVAWAFVAGLEKLAAQGKDISRIAGVASFFVSRIDSLIDSMLAEKLKTSKNPEEREALEQLMGKIAVANAKLAYQRYLKILKSDRWNKLASKGARTQRLLWASTSTKNPKYRDVMYVEELIGQDTVNTMPPSTLEAFREHGRARPSLEEDIAQAQAMMQSLETAGISMKTVTDRLVDEGVKLFIDAFDQLLGAISATTSPKSSKIGHVSFNLPPDLAGEVTRELEQWRLGDKTRRLWARDASLWTGGDEARWMDWLDIVEKQMERLEHLTALREEVKKEGFTHAVVLGMGGSSLAPDVLREIFGKIGGYPELLVLDSTDPSQVKSVEAKIDIAKTLFIVSSKSGTTLEPNIFKQYFFDLAIQKLGPQKAGENFIAVTDPGSALERVATRDGFRRTYHGIAGIGGRYSALSDFGMVPAAVMGLDVARLLNCAEEMVVACLGDVPAEQNPAIVLGVIMGVLANRGRDKVTLVISPKVRSFGAWAEQLLAESTGKNGRGSIPVDREPLGAPDSYGKDRLFIYVRLESAPDASQDRAVEALEHAGQPVMRISVTDPYTVGEGFFRWEIATAVAGSILGINPFDQPDVEASKIETRKLTEQYEKSGALPAEAPICEEKGIQLFADEKNAQALTKAAGKDRSLAGYLRAHLDRSNPGDYFALLAYIPMENVLENQLTSIRELVREQKRVATCVGFGPRFLHSTGQAYKGGPNTGVFLQITCEDSVRLPVPGQKYTFGIVKAAQARGDFQVLADRGRRALRVHLGADVGAGLKALNAAIQKALKPS